MAVSAERSPAVAGRARRFFGAGAADWSAGETALDGGAAGWSLGLVTVPGRLKFRSSAGPITPGVALLVVVSGVLWASDTAGNSALAIAANRIEKRNLARMVPD